MTIIKLTLSLLKIQGSFQRKHISVLWNLRFEMILETIIPLN